MIERSDRGYRPDIDGLRALAVLPVVLYHFGVPGLGGGFVGVDVFFVISGFLIGGLLWAELCATGRVRLGAFFLRRVRRLAPAYLAMAAVTLACAWFVLLPLDFREFGQQLIAATVYLANVHLFRDAGYFDSGSDQKLLLHTWSLAVEEQFYIVLPPLMLLLARARRLLPWLLAALGLASLVACVAVMAVSPPAGFYLFPFRAWELLAGVCLAVFGQRAGFGWRLHPALSWAGLALVLAAVTLLEAGEHFPGLYAAVPVLGAVLLIGNGRDENPVNRMLRSPPFLFFGLISYSLYLWHWPMVTVFRYLNGGGELPGWAVLPMLAAATAVSWLSWRLVEIPVRRGALGAGRLLAGYGLAAGTLVAVAFGFAFSNGWPDRFTPAARPYIAATQDFLQNWDRCTRPGEGPWAGLEICPIGPDGPPRVLVWGDSHARAFKEGLERAAWEAGTPALLIWVAGCPPLTGLRKHELASTPAQDADCAASGGIVRQGLAASPSIDRVLILGRWSYYAEGTGVGIDAHNWVRLAAADGSAAADGPAAPAAQAELLGRGFAETLAWLGPTGREVFVLRQVPEIFDYSARKAAQTLAYSRRDPAEVTDGMARVSRPLLDGRFAAADAILDRLAAAGGIRVIDLRDRLCTAEACSALLDGQPIYFDNNHITNTGALALRDGFAPVFAAR